MVDRITADKRSALMSRIRGRDTRPERIVRSLVHRMGLRFRIGSSCLPGNPDLVFRRHKKVILVHGCFWHQHPRCPRAGRPQSHVKFWNTKLDRNIQRDRDVMVELKQEGWSCLVVWECETKDDAALKVKLRNFFVDRERDCSRY
jgi:DNA mismatch endonuclease (patch repair protein)